jgi:hypothetical protein
MSSHRSVTFRTTLSLEEWKTLLRVDPGKSPCKSNGCLGAHAVPAPTVADRVCMRAHEEVATALGLPLGCEMRAPSRQDIEKFRPGAAFDGCPMYMVLLKGERTGVVLVCDNFVTAWRVTV